MGEIVYWSCVLGFSPILLAIVLRIIAMVVGSSDEVTADLPTAFARPGRVAPHVGHRRIARAGGFAHGH
jgi:hypothetical protein